MHSIISYLARSRSDAGRSVRRVALLALFGWLGLLQPMFGQTFVAEWGEDDIGRIGPTGMAIDTVGTSTFLYVCDQPLGRILKIDLGTGMRVGVWGQTGNGPLEFNSPYGIAVDPTSHDLYIAERGNHRVQRITNTGKFVMGWGELGTGPGQFDSPIGIAADASGNVYVVDHMNSRIEKFHVQQSGAGWDVQFVKAWGSFGAAAGQFNMPYGITLSPSGVLWVADGRNHRLQKFDTNGNFVGTVGSFGTGNGQFVTPTWVNFDSTGAYYVAETNSDPQNVSATDIQNQRIQKFTASEAFVMKWGSYGEVGGQFKLPFDVVVDKDGYAYVSDYYNTRLQKFSLNAAPPPGGGTGTGTQFVNVSSRLRTNDDGAHTLIAGFVISGSAPKQVLIRGIGPTLASYGVSGVLPNPKLQVYSGQTLIAENEDWGGSASIAAAAKSVGAFDLPATSKDAAVLLTLQPGLYSAQVATNGGDGVAMVEVYDADGSSASRLINLSTRGFADTGDGVLVAGFVIKGSASKRVLVRGIGPTLATYGVSGPLANPVLKLYGSTNALIAQNDDWGTPQTVTGGATPATAAEVSAAATSAGAFPLTNGSKDASIVITLAPGLYSAIVSGASDTTGPAMVEVYELPSQ